MIINDSEILNLKLYTEHLLTIIYVFVCIIFIGD